MRQVQRLLDQVDAGEVSLDRTALAGEPVREGSLVGAGHVGDLGLAQARARERVAEQVRRIARQALVGIPVAHIAERAIGLIEEDSGLVREPGAGRRDHGHEDVASVLIGIALGLDVLHDGGEDGELLRPAVGTLLFQLALAVRDGDHGEVRERQRRRRDRRRLEAVRHGERQDALAVGEVFGRQERRRQVHLRGDRLPVRDLRLVGARLHLPARLQVLLLIGVERRGRRGAAAAGLVAGRHRHLIVNEGRQAQRWEERGVVQEGLGRLSLLGTHRLTLHYKFPNQFGN